MHEIAPGWYWHSWMSFPNHFFDPLVVLAWQWTRKPRFLGYLMHRAQVFPAMAHDAARCFTGHSFNVINHAGEAVPNILRALAEAGEDACLAALRTWKLERANDGFPVSDGPYSGFDAGGEPMGNRLKIAIRLGTAAEARNDSDKTPSRIRFGVWDNQERAFID